MNILERLKTEILTGDGAVGTMLYAKGVSLESNFEHLNLVRPSLVLELASEYVAAGAQVIETNTFGANRTQSEQEEQKQAFLAALAKVKAEFGVCVKAG